MEEMSVGRATPAARTAGVAGDRTAPRDLREWIMAVEPLGQLQRIKEEVERDEEMGAITYMAHQTINAPALLFERIRGCPPGFQSLWNLIGSSVDRFAISIGEPTGLTVMDLIQRCKTKFSRAILPVIGDGQDAPVNAHHMMGDEVDITVFPAARHWPGVFGSPTAAHFVSRSYNLPILVVLFNNRAWNAVKRATKSYAPDGWAVRTGAMPMSDLDPAPGYELICRASGGHGERVEDPAQLPEALARALRVVSEEQRQTLLNVICKKP